MHWLGDGHETESSPPPRVSGFGLFCTVQGEPAGAEGTGVPATATVVEPIISDTAMKQAAAVRRIRVPSREVSSWCRAL